jgi:hypothetical protein
MEGTIAGRTAKNYFELGSSLEHAHWSHGKSIALKEIDCPDLTGPATPSIVLTYS